MRYVVISPPAAIVTELGHGGGPITMPVTVAGIRADLNKQGFIYDRARKQLTAFTYIFENDGPSHAAPTASGVKLLYSYPWSGSIRVTDLNGHLLAKHSIQEANRYVQFIGWDVYRSQFWFAIRQVRSNLPNDEPEADTLVILWDAHNDGQHYCLLHVEQIRRAISASK